ncbi:MAG: triose-phosphate isomerase [Planctomycetes bacterium]|nr:triose-phosphate isomerase [Planctomycetota bacterium]
MRRILVAGNWKMNLTVEKARSLAREVARRTREGAAAVDVAVFPPYPYLLAVAEALSGSPVRLGGQDLHWEAEGAFTGAVSGAMLREAGCRMVLVGHSERRHVFGETDVQTNKKVHAALNHGLDPILCVGEKLDEREAGRTEQVLARQLAAGLEVVGGRDMPRVTIAYEPVWAIGTGRTATPQTASEAHAFLRRQLAERFGSDTAEATRILYGGSVKPDNAASLVGQPDVDGLLVGGASLDAESFSAIVKGSSPPC